MGHKGASRKSSKDTDFYAISDSCSDTISYDNALIGEG